MKKSSIMFLLIVFISCNKVSNEPDTISVDLAIISTNTPKTILQGQDILSNVICSGSNLCYAFSNFEINETQPKIFDIKAKGTLPNSKKRDVVCLQAFYYKDTTLKINTSTKGQYILKFYNNNLLSKSDTVQVN